MKCVIPGCEREASSPQGWCAEHYAAAVRRARRWREDEERQKEYERIRKRERRKDPAVRERERRRDRERCRKRYYERKAAGLCVMCGKEPARKGRVSCEGCGKREAERSTRYDKANEAAKRERNRKAYQRYKGERKAKAKRRYDERKAAGLCTRCGRVRVKDETRCAGCRDHMNALRRK